MSIAWGSITIWWNEGNQWVRKTSDLLWGSQGSGCTSKWETEDGRKVFQWCPPEPGGLWIQSRTISVKLPIMKMTPMTRKMAAWRERERERQNKKGFSLMRYTEERRGLWKFLADHIHLALSGYMEKANTVRQQQKALCVTASVFLYTYPNLLWGAQRQRLYQAQVKGSG